MDEVRLSIEEEQQRVIEEIMASGDILSQYTYLIESARALPVMSAADKARAATVPTCQSNVWLLIEPANGRLRISADSDTLVVRGFLGLLTRIFSNRTCPEIEGAELRVFSETELSDALSSERLTGFSDIVRTIKEAAHQHADDLARG